MIRTLRRGLSAETVALLAEQRSGGEIPLDVHLMLVHDSQRREVGEVACGFGLGEWVTGVADEVTCPDCLEHVHA